MQHHIDLHNTATKPEHFYEVLVVNKGNTFFYTVKENPHNIQLSSPRFCVRKYIFTQHYIFKVFTFLVYSSIKCLMESYF